MEKIKSKYPYAVIIIIPIIVLAILVMNFLITLNWGDSKRGTFGDMFGASNSLFSGLAFIGIVYTIYLQKKELKKQENELQETKENIKIQQFESTYFSLLSSHQGIVNSLEIVNSNENTILKGRTIFRKLYEIEKQEDNSLSITSQNIDDLGHYFRNIYRIMKFVNQMQFDSDTKKNGEVKYQYLKFLRSQLSSFELIWICYWGFAKEGIKCKSLFENYTLFLHIPQGFKDNKELKSKYDKQAFYVKPEYNKHDNQLENDIW